MGKYFYTVYGLQIGSELELPELTPSREVNVDVTVRFGSVPEHLPMIKGSGILFEAAENDFLFKLEGVGRYRVQNGCRITIQAENRALPEDIRLILLGSCIGALLHQRGMLAIHGSAITDGTQAAIFSGPSGVGKSALAAGLLELGYSVIADDISVICQNGKQGFRVAHGIPHLKLWKDVLDHLNQDDKLAKVRPQLDKYRKPIHLAEQETPLLSKVVILSPSNNNDYSLSEILGREKFHLLRSNTYRMQFIDKMELTQAHFHNLSLLVNSIRMYEVQRPHNPLKIMEFAKYVSEMIY